MAISRPKTVSFRLSDDEFNTIKRKAGSLSVGEYARRAALEVDTDDRAFERRAIGKSIRAIHVAIAGGLSDENRRVAKALLAEALAVVEFGKSSLPAERGK